MYKLLLGGGNMNTIRKRLWAAFLSFVMVFLFPPPNNNLYITLRSHLSDHPLTKVRYIAKTHVLFS